MSDILAIYDTLVAMSVTVGSTTPTAYDLDQLPNAVRSAMLPVRLLLPTESRGDAEEFMFVALGKTATVRWRITDLLLWQPVAQGRGLQDVADDLVTYAGAYLEALRDNRAPSTQSYVVSASASPGVYEWPGQSGNYFFGCECVVTIEEVLSG
jgi:hypothetical protein